jgi:hypothetical protein
VDDRVNEPTYVAGYQVTPDLGEEPEVYAEIGQNFRSVARGMGLEHRAHAERFTNARVALELMERYPVLTEEGAILMAQQGRWGR